MKVTDLIKLWVGYNATENFRILICALDIEEARVIAAGYRYDNQMEGSFEITEFSDVETQFDCDYVITYTED